MKQIYDRSKKRRDHSLYLLAVDVHLLNAEDEQVPCCFVCVRNKSNRKDCIAILTTDMNLVPDEVVELYGK